MVIIITCKICNKIDFFWKRCNNHCKSQGYSFFGLYDNQCRCGNSHDTDKKADSECDKSCPGDSSMKCGAKNCFFLLCEYLMSVYQTDATTTMTSTTSTTTTITTTTTTTTPTTTTTTTAYVTTTSTIGLPTTTTHPCAPHHNHIFIADPSDPTCKTYLSCQYGALAATYTCAAGTSFSLSDQNCDWDYNDPDCGLSTTAMATTPTTTYTGMLNISSPTYYMLNLNHLMYGLYLFEQ